MPPFIALLITAIPSLITVIQTLLPQGTPDDHRALAKEICDAVWDGLNSKGKIPAAIAGDKDVIDTLLSTLINTGLKKIGV